MSEKATPVKARAITATSPAKTGNGKSIQRKAASVPSLPSSIQRKEQPGSWVHQQPQKPVNAKALIQPKVKIHSSNDRFEKEADHVADTVVSNQQVSSSTKITSTSSNSGVQKKYCSNNETSIQTRINNSGSPQTLNSSDNSPPMPDVHTTHPLTSVLTSQNTRGSPLPSSARVHMENRMRADFSNVRIHTGQESHDANTSIGARAFTQGSNIHFANGQFNPNTKSGQYLLAHELTHTIQQGASPTTPGSVTILQRSETSNDNLNNSSVHSDSRGPPLQTKSADIHIQCSLVDIAVSRIGELLNDLPSITEGLEGAKRWLMNKAQRFASFIPGYAALGVVMGQDPFTGEHIERNGRNFINAALDIIPGGGLLKQKLEELGAIDKAAAWIDQQLETLSSIVAGIRDEFVTAWNALGITSILDGPLNVLRSFGDIFERAINRLISFAERAASELLSIVKQFLLTQIVDFIKNHTNAYELLKVIIGHDPVTEEPVARNGTNILNALLEFGGEQGREQRRQMQDTGTFQKAADWIDRGIAVFGNLYQTIRDNFGLIWNAVSIESLMHPIDTFNKLYEKFAEPIRQVLNFVAEALEAILGLIKEVLLQRLSAWARTVRGYPLLTILIGKDPFTNQVVPRSIPNIIRGFMSLMEGGEEQYRQMEESGAIARTTQQINAAVARLNMTPATILQLFIDLWNSFSFNDLAHPIQAFQRIIDRFGQPIARLIAFVIEIVKIVIHVILEMMNLPFDLINNIINRAMAAFERIKRDPVAFLKNLLRAIKQGFIQFFNNIGTHLLNGLVGWLMSELRDANVPAPTDFTLRGIIGWVLQILGISMEAIWQKLAAHPRIGPERVARIRSMINTLEGIWTFIRDVQQRGIAAIWDKIQEQLSNLWNTVLDAIKNWIIERIITQVTVKLLSMLDPTGIMAVINSAIAIYRAVQSFIRYLRQMLEIINSFVNGVADIAEGNIVTAANYLERTMDRAMPIVIGFLANQVGLSGIGRRIAEMITRVRQMVDRALTWLVNRAVDTGFAFIDRLMSLGRSAVGAVRGWMGLSKNFKAKNGEDHTLSTRDSGGRQELMVASITPMPVRQFLATITVAGNEQRRARSDIQNKLIAMDTLLASVPAPTATDREKEIYRLRVEDMAQQITDDLAELMAAATENETARTTMPVFDGTIGASPGWGKGMRVQIINTPPPGGSVTGSASGHLGWQALRERKQSNPTGRTLYVQGHLLNNHLGGPGTNFNNLTPLTQDANAEFERQAESYIKDRLSITTGTARDAERRNTGMLFQYNVIPAYGRSVNGNLINRINAIPTGTITIPGNPPSQLTANDKITLINIITQEQFVPTSLHYNIIVKDPGTDQEMEEFTRRNQQLPNAIDQNIYHIPGGTIQLKHKKNLISNHHEKEADHIADKIVSHKKSSPEPVSKISNNVKQHIASVNKKQESGHSVSAAIATQNTRGSPLPAHTKTKMEKHIGADFSNVRIHTNEESNKANISIGSRAFTQGANIHFAKGEFKPNTKEGQHLLAHELTHTVQQGASPHKEISSSNNEIHKAASETTHTDKATATKTKTSSIHPETVAAEDPKKPASKKVVKKKSPSTPEEDPAFQKTIHKAQTRTREQKAHASPLIKAGDAQNAATAVPNEAESKAQNRKTDNMNEAGKDAKLFDAASFKKDLLVRINEITPKTLEEADEFKEHNRIDEVKGEMNKKVTAEKENTTGPVTHATAEPLHVNDADKKQPVTLPPTDKGNNPASIGAKNAAPKQKTDDEISMQEQSASLDDEMKQNNVTEDQLQGSNEPSFQSAVKEKRSAQKDAAEKPLLYRKSEAVELKSAENEAASKAAVSMHGMHNERGKNFAAVVVQQNDSKKKDEDARSKVAKDINDKYAETEKNVNDLLTQAETLSNSIFETGAEDARKIFEDYTDEKMRAYKADRYGGLLGGGYWLKDKFFDLPDEVNVFYEDGKKLYLDKMDHVLTEVSTVIADKLNAAKKAIDDGKQKIDDYVAGLPDNLKAVGTEAADNIKDKFDSLEQSVKDKGHQLIEGLAKKYVDNVKKLDDRINELKEANKGLISKAIGLLKAIWKVIKNIYQLFKTILSKLAQIVGTILGAPGKFFSNLGAAFNKGFDMFKSRLDEHLENGLMAWLSTQLGVADLKLPEKFDIASIFGMVLQVMGISYPHIRERAVEQIGEERVALMETSVGFFQRIYKEGLGAIWEIIKEKFTDFKDMIWEAIKTFIRDSIIKAAIIFLLSLLNPIAAFVKACMAIYDFLMMLVRMKDRIIDLLNSILDAITTIASGSVDAAAAAIEKAFAKSIPIIIGFLAALLHLNNIGAKVRDIILRIRSKVDKLIDWLIVKAYALVSPIVEAAIRIKNKGKALVAKGKEKIVQAGTSAVHTIAGWLGLRKSIKLKNGQVHNLYFEQGSKKLTLASTPVYFGNFLNNLVIPQHKQSTLSPLRTECINDLQSIDNIISNNAMPEAQKTAQIQLILQDLGAKLAELMEGAQGVSLSSKPPQYGSQYGGFGTAMRVQIVDGRPAGNGSQPSVTNANWDELKKRKTSEGNKDTYYIRAHLLNDHIGGPGNNFDNLSILTQRANNRDWWSEGGSHEVRVEVIVKRMLSENRSFIYVVTTVHGKSVNTSLLAAIAADNSIPVNRKQTLANIVTAEQFVPTAFVCTIHEIDPFSGQPVEQSQYDANITIPNAIENNSPGQYAL